MDHRVTKPSTSQGAAQGARAPKACAACRRKKTRCFASPGIACSRCKALSIVCSFEEELVARGRFASVEDIRGFEAANNNVVDASDIVLGGARPALDSQKLQQIHEDVKKIARYLMANEAASSIRQMPMFPALQDARRYNGDARVGHSSSINNNSSDSSNYVTKEDPWQAPASQYQRSDQNHNQHGSMPGALLEDKIITPLTMVPLSYMTSPFNVLKESPVDSLLPFPVAGLLNPTVALVDKDIVSLGFITTTECFSLLNIFRDKYGKWISLAPNTSTEELLHEYRKESPLLLDVCCLLALRSSQNQLLRKKLTKLLPQRVSQSLSRQVLRNTALDLKFISTLALLSIYGYSLSLSLLDFTIDPWFYSGLGLGHFITSVNYNPSFVSASISIPDAAAQYDLLTYMRIYDHLLITHLFNCIVSGRTCSLDRIRLNKVRSKLDIVFAGTFDGKMTAEVYLCDIVYDFFVNDPDASKFKLVEHKLAEWYASWKYLIDQPIPQLLEYLYNFYSLLVVYHINFQLYFTEFNYGEQNSSGSDKENSSYENDNGNDSSYENENDNGNNSSNPNIINSNNNPTITNSHDDSFPLFQQHNNFETLDKILAKMEPYFANKVCFNALKVVNEILSFISKANTNSIIDSSEQFEYLSDQIHFSLFFTITVLIRLLNQFFTTYHSLFDQHYPWSSSSSPEDLKHEYSRHFNAHFIPFDVRADLRAYILKAPALLARLAVSLVNISRDDFVLYVAEILIVVKKYYVSGNPGDPSSLFYRHYVTLRNSLKKCFPDLDLSIVEE